MKSIKSSLFGVAIAFLFLFNPNITVIDFLPDFIGYFILTVALTRLSDLNETLQEARQLFFRMIWIDAGKILAILWIFGVEASSEKSSSMMLWTFVFGVLELLMLIPAYTKLFDGMISLGNFYESRSIFYVKKENTKRSLTEKIKRLTLIFIVLKSVLAFLPELADLGNTSYTDADAFGNLYRYINVMRGMSFAVVLIFGCIWLVRILAYWHRVRTDTVLQTELDTAYSQKVLPKKGIFIRRSVRTAFSCLLVAAFFSLDFRLERFNLTPDILTAFALLLFFLFLQKQVSIRKGISYTALGTYAVSCILSMVLQYAFFNRYTYHSLIRSDEALALFTGMVTAEILQAVLFVLLMLTVLDGMRRTVSQHTGYVIGQDVNSEAARRQILTVQKEQKRTLVYLLIATIVYAISNICYSLLIPVADFMGLLDMLFGIAFIAFAAKAQNEIYSAVDTKYMLE